jgi:hypothetical protein
MVKIEQQLRERNVGVTPETKGSAGARAGAGGGKKGKGLNLGNK